MPTATGCRPVVGTCPSKRFLSRGVVPMNVITDALACIAHFLGWLV
ncbi:hypothetical protein [Streptomyces sp. NPDC002644]